MHEAMLKNPAGETLWGGHRREPFKMVERDDVIAAAVGAIQKRSLTVTVPAGNAVAALAPGLLRGVIGKIGFSDETILKATELARPSGRRRS